MYTVLTSCDIVSKRNCVPSLQKSVSKRAAQNGVVTYASYFTPDTNIRQTAFEVGILDTLVAILAGLVIFPAVFSVGIEPDAGPSLVFITLPSVFSSMPLSQLWSSIFFLLLVIAALTSTISLHEATTAYLAEEWNLPRKHQMLAVYLLRSPI